MKQIDTTQEILLFTGTNFTNREFCIRNNEKDNGRKVSSAEELEKACWNGLLHEMLPELVGCPSAKSESFIWHIMSGNNFINISMGACPPVMENEASVDPYFFLNDLRNN